MYPKTTVEVTCPACKETYNIRTETEEKKRNCRCGKGTFIINQGTGFNQVRVTFISAIGTRSDFTNFTVIAQSKE
jgi:hypothetical protein